MLYLRHQQIAALKSSMLDRFSKRLASELALKLPHVPKRFGDAYLEEVRAKVSEGIAIGFKMEQHVAFFVAGALLYPESFEALALRAVDPAAAEVENFAKMVSATEPLFSPRDRS